MCHQTGIDVACKEVGPSEKLTKKLQKENDIAKNFFADCKLDINEEKRKKTN